MLKNGFLSTLGKNPFHFHPKKFVRVLVMPEEYHDDLLALSTDEDEWDERYLFQRTGAWCFF